MPLRRVAFAVALLIVALSAQRSEADLISWSYTWSAQPVVLDADPLGPDSRPTGGITLTPGAITITGGKPGVAQGNANIVAVNLTAFAFSPSPDDKPYHFTNAPYHLGVTLTDVDSKVSGTLTFAGVFNGTFTNSHMDLDTSFTSPTQQSLTLGHNVYTVKLTAYTPPGPPEGGGEGNISALVTVQPAPEPSTFLLAAIGVFATSFVWVRRRRGISRQAKRQVASVALSV
ncbi:MAG TPA: PEP-CTERM sorting domain-containing protein [Gemmataceae bacterium]|nr:PEP-CTERM sorting domain-containing protein [Gemmataceae bacterium]